jgi:hypothetical protein
MMNASEHEFTELLDRLVDGDLTGQPYRQLLSDLETQPNGWRRCALAFLEAQAWRSELRTMPQECGQPESPSTGAILPAARRRMIEWLLAAAVGILIALPLGMQLRRQPETVVTPSVPESEDGVEATEIVQVTDTGRDEGSVEDVGTDYEAWLDQEGSALPVELVRALESIGTQIRRQRGLLPVETEDGRRFVMPIERVEFTPISYSQYR